MKKDIKFEKIHSNKKNILFFIGIVCVVVLLITLVLTNSLAKYRSTASIPIVNSEVNYVRPDLNIVAMYQKEEGGEYVSIDTVPTTGYTLNESESYCTINGTKDSNISVSYDINTQMLKVSPMITRGTKCYLYFDEMTILPSEQTLINLGLTINEEMPDFSKTSCSSGCEEVTVGLYAAIDDDGTSYYFRGDVNNNYVYFAGFYWRIIRINGNGSIRLIYQGTNANEYGQIGTSVFNNEYEDNMYVGFKYATGEVHGTEISSLILNALNIWYDSNLGLHEKYLDINAGFCGDRTAFTNFSGTISGGGIDKIATYYGPIIRLYSNSSTDNAAPSFKCSNVSDLFTDSSSEKGNKSLENPIGLITADEISYAGGVLGVNNREYYLYSNSAYWSMSPSDYDILIGRASVFYVNSSGRLYTDNVNYSKAIRPVINLKADTLFTGTGTSIDPFTVISQ